MASKPSLRASRCDEAPIEVIRVPPQRSVPGLEEDARAGLVQPPRSLPPKYFYDAYGSELFDRICYTQDYYPTRTEAALLEGHADDIIAAARPRHLVELGAGALRKTHHLLDACDRQTLEITLWPFDVCQPIMEEAAERLVARHERLRINILVGDYLAGLGHLPAMTGPRLFVFLGGTIGNFTHDEAVAFLGELRALMGPDDRLLIGADRIKDSSVLTAAYNDREGVTAAFNRNLLNVLNRELEADFSLEGFRHEAVFDPAASRVEMRLVAEADQSVYLGRLDTRITFESGESILTEISRKFSLEGLTELLAEAGLTRAQHYEPADGAFSLLLAGPAA